MIKPIQYWWEQYCKNKILLRDSYKNVIEPGKIRFTVYFGRLMWRWWRFRLTLNDVDDKQLTQTWTNCLVCLIAFLFIPFVVHQKISFCFLVVSVSVYWNLLLTEMNIFKILIWTTTFLNGFLHLQNYYETSNFLGKVGTKLLYPKYCDLWRNLWHDA